MRLSQSFKPHWKQVKLAQFRIFSDRDPGALNQPVAQPAVARPRDGSAILFIAGRMLAR